MKTILLIIILSLSFSVQANFIGGIGYIQPGQYRVDNEINPLPLGTSIVPMIFYRGERLTVLGPNVSYALLKGMFSVSVNLTATGDRYETESIEMRDTAINGGVSLRIMFLTLNYGSDISNVYQGNTANINIGWRFKISENLFFSPSVGKEFLNQGFVNFYYGVSDKEASLGRFTSYKVGNAVNDNYRAGITYVLNERNSFVVNYSYKVFDNVIFDSPTINERAYGTTSLFWNYKF